MALYTIGIAFQEETKVADKMLSQELSLLLASFIYSFIAETWVQTRFLL